MHTHVDIAFTQIYNIMVISIKEVYSLHVPEMYFAI